MPVSVSIGVSAVDARSKEIVHAFAAAETACKAANDRGRNRVEVYQEADESIVRRFTDINLVADLRAAIAEDRLELNAQLIVPLGNHEGPPHFEILLRMIGENGEIVGPDNFMSAAHRYQLMPTLDRWVISTRWTCSHRMPSCCAAARSYLRSIFPASRCRTRTSPNTSRDWSRAAA